MHAKPAVLALLLGVGLELPAHAAAPPAPVPRTGQTVCYGAFGTVPCAGSGQDGDAAAGAAWPEPRFTAGGDRTIADALTGLVWSEDAGGAGGPRSWEEALDHVRTLNRASHLGRSDWRLPNVNELESLVNKQEDPAEWLRAQGFRNVQPDYYWTATTYAGHPGYAWGVGLHRGIVAGRDKADLFFVWPVRRGAPGAVALPQTGQTACHDRSGAPIACAGTGQDGETQAGATWPSPRFVAGGEGTMSDRLTGLEWSREALAPGPDACGPGAPRVYRQALDLVRCLNDTGYLGRRDWRLPNRNELATLVHRGQPDSSAWLSSLGFSGVQSDSYWSSTTFVHVASNGWSVNLHDGAVTSHAKTRPLHVWPVRGGP